MSFMECQIQLPVLYSSSSVNPSLLPPVFLWCWVHLAITTGMRVPWRGKTLSSSLLGWVEGRPKSQHSMMGELQLISTPMNSRIWLFLMHHMVHQPAGDEQDFWKVISTEVEPKFTSIVWQRNRNVKSLSKVSFVTSFSQEQPYLLPHSSAH